MNCLVSLRLWRSPPDNKKERANLMMEKLKDSAFVKMLKSGDKKVKIIMLLGILGILLIFLSQVFSSPKPKENQTVEAGETVTTAEYRKMLEQDLAAFISQIEGAGETKVMVTLKGTGETVYLKEQKTDVNQQGETGAESFSEHRSVSESYVVTDGKDGRNTVVKSQLEPEIKGVVVVCAGGDSPVVQSRILDAVTTALDLSSVRVYISKLAK